MRRPHSLIQSKSNQQGFALFIVLMMMVAIALLVVAAMQSYNTEQRISTNVFIGRIGLTGRGKRHFESTRFSYLQ